MASVRPKYLKLKVLRATCGQLPVVLGAAPASQLWEISFADVLDEGGEQGYQRPMDRRHSREFRAYIETPGATTIPLTFNLRGREGKSWTLTDQGDGVAVLAIRESVSNGAKVLAQVDCQHRLGSMRDSDIPLTFQCFLGLEPRDEMAIFSIINGKAKGLSSSLLDYHSTKLIPDLDVVQLDLYIAKRLHDDPESVWQGKIKLGGASTQGNQRRISLRGLQTATKLLLHQCLLGTATELSPIEKYQIVRAFWSAVAQIWPIAWTRPRTHLLTKGVGVNALSLLAGELVTLVFSREQRPNATTFVEYLTPLAALDWSTSGPFKAFGGRHGANEVHQLLRSKLFAPGLAVVRGGN
jgi:DGQHR domain-containing protein